MTENEIKSRSSSESDDSLVLVESGDVIEQEVTAVVPPPEEEQVPSNNATVSGDSQEQLLNSIETIDIGNKERPSLAPSSVETASVEENDDEIDDVPRERKVGAGIAVGIVSAPFLGPVLAVVAGVAAAYGTSQKGFAGDACRAAGDIALVAKDKALEVDEKHGIGKKTKSGADQLLTKAKEVNERHEILEKMHKALVITLKHVASVLQSAADKMKESREKKQAAKEARSFKDDPELFSYEKVKVGEVA